MLQACIADLRGRTNFENSPYPQADFLSGLAKTLREADISEVQQQGLSDRALGAAIQELRLKLIEQYKQLALENTGEAGIQVSQQSV